MLEIDGSHGEGGGQLVRTAVAVSAVTGKEVHITNVRAKRQEPGLSAQHVAAVRLASDLCGGQVEGLAAGSRELTFRPSSLKGGEFVADVGTAGSIPLVLQAGVLAASFAPSETRITVTGGTDVRKAPSMDYISHVLVPLLGKLGIGVSLEVRKRGYYPRGGGEVLARILPSRPSFFKVEGPGRLQRMEGRAHVVDLPADIAKRMAGSALPELRSFPAKTEILEEAPPGLGPGTGITLWATTEHSVLGASALGERSLRAENVGALAGRALAAELKAGASLDVHAGDQLLPYLALGAGGSFTVRELSTHAETGLWLLNLLTGARFTTEKKYGLVRVAVEPAGA